MTDKTEFLKKLDDYLTDHGLSASEYLDTKAKLDQYGLPALAATKSILNDIYSYRPPTGDGILRKVKNKIINLIRNVSISTIELSTIKQNKFNELTYQFIDMLVAENKELRERITKLESRK
jgi:DNA primase large subunit